jgi:hypothetical protein
VLDDKPSLGLVSGQVGTVVEILAPGVFEVEFLGANGRTMALQELTRADLLVAYPRNGRGRLIFSASPPDRCQSLDGNN